MGQSCACLEGFLRSARRDDSAGRGSSSGADPDRHLTQEYDVGEKLGEGAFGVVFCCTKKGDGQNVAAKMVDKVETPLEAIQAEVDLMRRLHHRNIVSFHAVFYEACFVCIVMELFLGGDLLFGMESHWDSKGLFTSHESVHIAAQMVAAVAYLHSLMFVHRDIKGDNFLMDRMPLADPECRIALSDFGTTRELKPGERLHEDCGSEPYWSPEFYDGDYSFKVDIWALGVIVFGMVRGRYPFNNREEVMTKLPKLKIKSEPCKNFLASCFEKDESERISAAELMQHTWIANVPDHADGVDDSTTDAQVHESNQEQLKERKVGREDVNEGVMERRRVLLESLCTAQGSRRKSWSGTGPDAFRKTSAARLSGLAAGLGGRPFMVTNSIKGTRTKFEWVETSIAEEYLCPSGGRRYSNVSTGGRQGSKMKSEFSARSEEIKRLLRSHHVDLDAFGVGKAKTLAEFVQEVHSGASMLMIDASKHKQLVRIAELVIIKLRSGPDPDKCRYLVQNANQFPDGRKVDGWKLPGSAKKQYENIQRCAERLLMTQLGVSPRGVELLNNAKQEYHEEVESSAYPGIRTVFRKVVLEGYVKADSKETLAQLGLPALNSIDVLGEDNYTRSFQWLTDEDCNKKVPVGTKNVNAGIFVQAPLGLEEAPLQQYLEEHGLNVSSFGTGEAKSLKDLSKELTKGEATLAHADNGDLLRVVDSVVLYLQNRITKKVLMQTDVHSSDGSVEHTKCLPSTQIRADENQFVAARRILQQQLRIDEILVEIHTPEMQTDEVCEDSNSYPGLQTLCRRRAIHATLLDEKKRRVSVPAGFATLGDQELVLDMTPIAKDLPPKRPKQAF